jgi:flagellar hook-associated protein 2
VLRALLGDLNLSAPLFPWHLAPFLVSSIQSSVGLISGIPIQDTVDQLISVASQPLSRLNARTQGLAAERRAVDTLASLVLGLKSSLNAFKTASTFTKKTASSSDATVLSASVATGKSPAAGAYQFTPVQLASSHQLVSGSFDDLSGGLGNGALGFRFGGHVDKGLSLSEINGGAGFAAGKIKITDRAGDTAIIDLRGARNVDDVIEAINSSGDINVTASVDGDSFKLTDNTGGAGNLIVREVGQGTTAASLGFDGNPVAANEATGADIYRLHGGTSLAHLNDGNGVRILDDLQEVDDLQFTLQDETVAGVDLSGATTLQGVVDAINNDEDLTGKVAASISADGRRLEIADLTTGAGTFSIASLGAGSAAEDLGLTEAASSGTIIGRRLVAGLRDTLVSSLNGGQGFDLHDISITDRAGNPAVPIDLSTAETLGDVVNLINASGANVTASINGSRNGIAITDTSGGTGNLVVANGATGATADDLGIAANDAVASVNSGSLNRQTISESTLLASLNGGKGIKLGDVRITDSNGQQGVLDLNAPGKEPKTIGDVIDAINALSNGVEAQINDSGDGILITDTAAGSGTLKISDINGATAAGLRLAGESSATDGSGQQIINGSSSYSIDLSDLSADAEGISLASLNDAAGVNLGIFQVFASNDTDAVRKRFEVDLRDAATMGDVIDKINSAATERGVAVTAQFTDGGTGIELIDTAGGTGNLTVVDLGSGAGAADLGIAGTAGAANSSGEQKITAVGLFDANDAEKSALDLVVKRINELGAGVTASVVNDGGGFRLSLSGDKSGADNELLIDDPSGLFAFKEVSRPKDAVILYGASANSNGIAVSSSDNNFEGVVDGLKLSVKAVSSDPITVTVAQDNAPVVTAVKNFVAAYNSIRKNLDTVTDFDADANTTGVLFGRNESLRVDTTLSRIASGGFNVGGEFASLESIGVSLDDKGKLSLDEAALNDALSRDSGGVKNLLENEKSGVLAKFSGAMEQLAGGENSLLSSRSESLQSTIDSNNERLQSMDASLTRQRDRLLLEFYNLEETIAGFQSNISLLDSIQFVSYSNNK